jgi:hypothetical protein
MSRYRRTTGCGDNTTPAALARAGDLIGAYDQGYLTNLGGTSVLNAPKVG